MNKKDFFILIGLSLFLVISRLFPHLPNFVPVGAIFLASGVYLPKKSSLFFFLVFFITDFFIGFYDWRLMISVYGSFLAVAYLGKWLGSHKSVLNIFASAIMSGIIFYIITNFAVWLFSDWYERSIDGLIMSYYLALPFFRYTLLGNIFYSIIIFSSLEIFYYSYTYRIRIVRIFEMLKNKLYNIYKLI